MNADSSRSHMVVQVKIRSLSLTGKETTGKVTIVDLAGSERLSKLGKVGDEQLRETRSINKSLSSLGDVIAALKKKSSHIPYRNHPLTALLSDSLGGSSKSLLFVCCSPADYNRSESVSSLDFGSRWGGVGGGGDNNVPKFSKKENESGRENMAPR
jgi:hypothetical protein